MPSRLEAALAVLDTDQDGTVDATEWEDAIESALANKLAARQAKRELEAKKAVAEIEEFTGGFLSAARKCFEMIDKARRCVRALARRGRGTPPAGQFGHAHQGRDRQGTAPRGVRPRRA